MTTPEAKQTGAPSRAPFLTGLAAWALFLCLFQFAGNAVRGYIQTDSLYHWWSFHWVHEGTDTEHGLLLLGIALYCFWRNLRGASPAVPGPASWKGLLLLGGGLLLHLGGFLTQQTRVSIVGFCVALLGMLALWGGSRWLRAAWFPMLLLLLSMPLEFLTDEIGFAMRMGVVESSHWIARTLGMDVVRIGSWLQSADGQFKYDVAPACSGIRSLVALFVLCLLMGYFSFRRPWKTALLAVLAFPYAFLGNILRILLIMLAGRIGGQQAGTVFHDYSSFLVFPIVLGLAYLTVRVMGRLSREEPEDRLGDGADWTRVPARTTTWCVVLLLVAATGTTTLRIRNMELSPEAGIRIDPATEAIGPVPDNLVVFVGSEVPMSKAEREVLPADTGYLRKQYVDLRNPDRTVAMSVVLSGRDRTSIHKPELCLPGQGWTIVQREVLRLPVPAARDGSLGLTVLTIERKAPGPQGDAETMRGLYAYWFVSVDGTVPTHRQRMACSARNMLTRMRIDRWAYVSVMVNIDGDRKEDAVRQLGDFINRALPHLQRVELKEGNRGVPAKPAP